MSPPRGWSSGILGGRRHGDTGGRRPRGWEILCWQLVTITGTLASPGLSSWGMLYQQLVTVTVTPASPQVSGWEILYRWLVTVTVTLVSPGVSG